MTVSIETKTLAAPFKKLTRKRKVYIHIVEGGDLVTTNGEYWSGGSKTEYQVVTPQGTRCDWVEGEEVGSGFPSFQSGKRLVSDGRILVEGGVFCGKPATVHIYCTENDCKKIVKE